MNGSATDAPIEHDRMKTLLELQEGSSKHDVLRAVLTNNYDNSKQFDCLKLKASRLQMKKLTVFKRLIQ